MTMVAGARPVCTKRWGSAHPSLSAAAASGSGRATCRLKSPWACIWQNSRSTMKASFGPGAVLSSSVSARAPSTEIDDGPPRTAGQVNASARMASTHLLSSGCWSSWRCGISVLVLGREPARCGRCGWLAISALQPEQLDRDPVRVAEHHQGVRQRLGALEQCVVLDTHGVEAGDPSVHVFPTGDSERHMVESRAQRVEHLPVGVGVVIKSQEQSGARTRHDDGVAVPGRVRLDEGSDETENTRVPSLAGDDVADRETKMLDSSQQGDCQSGWGCLGGGGHGGPPWWALSSIGLDVSY